MVPRPSRRSIVRGLVAVVVVCLVVSSGVLTVSYHAPGLENGTMTAPANGSTVIATQGWNAQNISLPGRPARLVSVGPNGSVNWIHQGPDSPPNWFYDVDPLPDGNLLVENPVQGASVVYEFDPENQTRVWTHRFDRPDIHDIDLINGDELLVAGISYDSGTTSDDSVFIYNRTQAAVTWRWNFSAHYPHDAGPGADATDWTHVNDVDQIRPGEFLVSVRNMDQVIAVNRSTKRIDLRLGRDDHHTTLYEQHNPDYLESKNGTPTVVVADSENDRIVEYERTGGPRGAGNWTRVWTLSGGLNWPRDADRLPNGNTLITDTLNSRVIEVTPRGKVVWEKYVPWATYDAERIGTGDESNGPTMHDQGVSGNYTIHGDSPTGTVSLPTVPATVGMVVSGIPMASGLQGSAARARHLVPWFSPRWMPTWGVLALVVAALVFTLWKLGGLVYHRRRVYRRLAAALAALRRRVTSR